MSRLKFTVALVFLLGAPLVAQVTNYTTEGSLRADHPLQCVPVSEITGKSSAADVTQGAVACLEAENYQGAAELVMVASAFAYFDTQRVSDPSAHVALQAIFADALSGQPQDRVEKMLAAIQRLSPDNSRHREICTSLLALGPPSYYPSYMIEHGMDAFTGSDSEPLVADFDAGKAWVDSLRTFIKCSEIDARTVNQ